MKALSIYTRVFLAVFGVIAMLASFHPKTQFLFNDTPHKRLARIALFMVGSMSAVLGGILGWG